MCRYISLKFMTVVKKGMYGINFRFNRFISCHRYKPMFINKEKYFSSILIY